MKPFLMITCLMYSAGSSASSPQQPVQRQADDTAKSAPQPQPQPIVIKSQEDPDYAPQILATFFGQLVPGLLKIMVGGNEKNPSPQLQADGAQQLLNGVGNFMYLVTRSPKGAQKFLDNAEEIMQEFARDPEAFVQESVRSLRKIKLPLAQPIEKNHP